MLSIPSRGTGLPCPLLGSLIFTSGNIMLFFFFTSKILASIRKLSHNANTDSRIGREFGRSSNLRTSLSCLVTYGKTFYVSLKAVPVCS